jgi:hypothetical protein
VYGVPAFFCHNSPPSKLANQRGSLPTFTSRAIRQRKDGTRIIHEARAQPIGRTDAANESGDEPHRCDKPLAPDPAMLDPIIVGASGQRTETLEYEAASRREPGRKPTNEKNLKARDALRTARAAPSSLKELSKRSAKPSSGSQILNRPSNVVSLELDVRTSSALDLTVMHLFAQTFCVPSTDARMTTLGSPIAIRRR